VWEKEKDGRQLKMDLAASNEEDSCRRRMLKSSNMHDACSHKIITILSWGNYNSLKKLYI